MEKRKTRPHGLNIPKFNFRIKAGALLDPFSRLYRSVAVQIRAGVSVPDDFGGRVEFAQVYQQREQRGLLCQRAGVLCLLLVIRHARLVLHATHIGDADAVRVVIGAMRSYFVNVTPVSDVAVAINHIMIAYVGKATVYDVVCADLVDGDILAFRRCRAMDDDFGYCPLALPET